MKAKFTSTKVKYYSRLIDKYINVIYELMNEKNDLENWEEQILIESMEDWKQGFEEIELKIISNKPSVNKEEEIIKLY
jgi:hypothetical protein